MLTPTRTFIVVDVEALLELGRDALGDLGRLVGVGADQHDAELVAAEPEHHVVAPRGPRQSRSDLPQQLVAGGVAEGVVDLLEVVEVDEEEGHLLGAGDRVGPVREEGVEHLEEVATVAESR